ncbi:MAG: hypothetical protein NW201_12700 [Gemmatimonadales bacterium]|nr:hypothetical protein [Gemmatimonadales bacterium]
MPSAPRSLAALTIGGAALAALFALLLVADPREITGAPAWLKPLKFSLSGALYGAGLWWITTRMPRERGTDRAGFAVAVLLGAEIAAIAVQAARGTTSHFNITTGVDAAVFRGMGLAIVSVWIATAWILWRHLRQPAADPGLAMAMRLGMTLTLVGSALGGAMLRPTPEQLATMQRGQRPPAVGAHTVGAPDGEGAMLPLIRWSAEHGDLRVAHFVGMHGLQLVPLALLGLRRARRSANDATERVAIWAVAALCAIATVGTLAQALAGHPLIALAARLP